MEIIRPGNKPENVRYQQTCKTCGCVFAYTKSDVKPDQREGDYLVCPTCTKFISPTYVPEIQIP